MAQIFTLAYHFLTPNKEREHWARTQQAWLALAAHIGMTPDDAREDTWPVTRRQLGLADGVVTTIGMQHLEGEDSFPIEALTCDVGPASLLSALSFHRVSTGDAAFDEHITVRANDDALARELLSEDLRGALQRLEGPFHLRYDRGTARLSWSTPALHSQHLENVLGVIIATCQRSATVPYR